ncbi:MAG: hypothetical protein ABSG32_23335 [Terriglobia bacterium]|jgi:hypothetical protein
MLFLKRLLCPIFIGLGFLSAAQAQITRIDIFNLSHMDIGFTDHPAVTREQQRSYIDVALDACAADANYRWTTESLVAVYDWWQAASPERRNQLLAAVDRGQIAIAALPLNNAPTLDRDEWVQMLHWVPADLWKQFHPSFAVQDDVNGFPRAGAVQLLDHGIHRLFMGMNSDSGGPPFHRPTAFWWRMPDGRRMMVYLGDSYPMGYEYFHESDWRRGPVPRIAETYYRPPHAGDFFKTDEASLRQAQKICLKQIQSLEAAGYKQSTLVLPFTNQWRMDNDPPFPPLANFVAAWNRLGLKPELRLVTGAEALEKFEAEAGSSLPELSGEWPDWWSNGEASAPREVCASRIAKGYLRASASPVFGSMDPQAATMIEEIRKDLCLFDEHSWGGANSVALPDSADTVGQWIEKARLAYRSMALGEWLQAKLARNLLSGASPGFYVVNSAPLPFTGWVTIPARAMRMEVPGVDHFEPGLLPWTRPQSAADLSPENDPAVFSDNQPKVTAKFWVENLAPNSVGLLKGAAAVQDAPELKKDSTGWPVSVRWKGMERPLFTQGLGDFLSVRPVGFAPRWILDDMSQGKPGKVEEVGGTAGKVEVVETGHTLVYKQQFTHPRLKRGTRTLEIWKSEPLVRLTLSINRLSSDAPESFYVAFPLPVEGVIPQLSEGGMPFTPYQDQLLGSCRDYFAFDGWAKYDTKDGQWLWVSRDAPLVTFKHPEIWGRRTAPAPADRILAEIYNNFWYTNFVGNENGAMEFQFDLLWKPSISDPQALANTVVSEPIVVQK